MNKKTKQLLDLHRIFFYILGEQMDSTMKLSLNDKRFLQYLGLLVTLYILPIILADFYYRDDIGRSVNGTTGSWKGDGRLLSWFLFKVLHFSIRAVDVSPLNQILIIPILTFTGFLIYKIFCKPQKLFLSIFICFFIIANPFFLSNISFKWDSLTMSLSVLCSASSGYVLLTGRGKHDIFFSLLLLLMSFFLYEVAIVVYMGLVLIYFVLVDPEKKIKPILIALAILLVSFLIYTLVTKPFINGWAMSHRISIFQDEKPVISLLNNFILAFNTISPFFWGVVPKILFLIPFCLSVIYVFWIFFESFRTKTYSLLSRLCIFISPFILIIIVFFPVLFLKDPVVFYRVFAGFSCFLLFSFLGSILFLQKIKFTSLSYLIIFPVLYCIIISYVYSHAQKVQRNFENQITTYIIEDLKSTNQIQTTRKLLFIDPALYTNRLEEELYSHFNPYEPLAPETNLIISQFPFVSGLIFREFSTRIADSFPRHFPILKIEHIYEKTTKQAKALIEKSKNYAITKENPIYTLKVVDNTALIEYKHTP